MTHRSKIRFTNLTRSDMNKILKMRSRALTRGTRVKFYEEEASKARREKRRLLSKKIAKFGLIAMHVCLASEANVQVKARDKVTLRGRCSFTWQFLTRAAIRQIFLASTLRAKLRRVCACMCVCVCVCVCVCGFPALRLLSRTALCIMQTTYNISAAAI